jgi:ankyrin repeat protein
MSDGTRRIPPVSEVFADPGLRRAAAAAEAGDVEQVRAQKRVDLNAVQPLGVNLLMYELGARNETLTPEGASPMLMAGVMEDPRWLGLLLDHGGDPNLKNGFGDPLLPLLVSHGRWENMVLLLDRGALIDGAGPSGQTATFLFATLHQFDRVYAMLERGADPDRADANGLTPRTFVMQQAVPGSPQEAWQKRVADRIGVTQ